MTTNRKPRVGPLDTVQAVRRELGRVYRAARCAEIETDKLRAFTYCLRELRECLVSTELEARLTALEANND